jgi:alkylmercury lyase
MANRSCCETESLNGLLDLFPPELLRLTPEEQRVSVSLYRLLAEGQPVSVPHLSERLRLDEDSVRRLPQAWPSVYFDKAGRIIGYWGLSLPEMDHRFEVEGRQLYTWCAWDSLWIPAILGKPAAVTSRCPESGQRISLTVSPKGVQKVAPAGAIMSFLRPEAGRWREDAIAHFCHFVHFFASPEDGERWIARTRGTFLLSLKEAYELGRRKNAAQYPDVL